MTEVTLGPRTGGAPLLTIERLRADLRLWPLLRGALMIEELTLDTPRVALAIDATGRPNWQGTGASATGGGSLPAISIARARVRDGRVDFTDVARGRRVAVEAIALAATLPALTAPAHVAGTLQLAIPALLLQTSFSREASSACSSTS